MFRWPRHCRPARPSGGVLSFLPSLIELLSTAASPGWCAKRAGRLVIPCRKGNIRRKTAARFIERGGMLGRLVRLKGKSALEVKKFNLWKHLKICHIYKEFYFNLLC